MVISGAPDNRETKISRRTWSRRINVYGAEAHVKRGDNVLKALDLMLRSSLIDVPVLDDDGKIIGEIKLSEILKKIIELDR